MSETETPKRSGQKGRAMESVDIVKDANGTKRERKVYEYNREDSISVNVGVTDLTLVACTMKDDNGGASSIGYRYLPSNANRPYYSDNAATGKYVGDALASKILGAGIEYAGERAEFVDPDSEPGKRGKPSSFWMRRANIVKDGHRVTVTLRERTKMVGGQAVVVSGEYVLNAWRNPVNENTGSGGRTAVIATEDASDL